MFQETAHYLRDALAGWSNCSILNLGSGLPAYYRVTQPFITYDLLDPLRSRNCAIVHVDHKATSALGHIRARVEELPFKDGSFDRVLCLSLLEHVESPVTVIYEVFRVLVLGGCAVFECPAIYPYHPDPIDTMLRPKTEGDWNALLHPLFTTFGFTTIASPSRGGTCTLIWAHKTGERD